MAGVYRETTMNPIILDFETFFSQTVTLKKLSYSEYIPIAEPICVSFIYDNQLHFYHEGDISEALALIPWDDAMLVGHNLLFDALVLKHWYGIQAKTYCDTLSLARLHHPSLDHSLGALAEKFCPSIPKLKENLKLIQDKTWDSLDDTHRNLLKTYNKNDVLITAKLFEHFHPITKPEELQLIDHTIKLWLNPVIQLDIEKAQTAIDEERQQISEQLTLHCLDKDTIRSDRMFFHYLQVKGYIPPEKWSVKQNKLIPAFAKTDSAFQEFYKDNPELQELLDLKRAINSNIKQSRTERLIAAANVNQGRVPIAYNYCGAFTGRFSGSNKTNLQNLPRGSILRDSLVAPDGHQFVVADLAQIEARVLAWLAGEEKILDAFRNKRDLYCELASIIFKKPITKKENPIERFIGKSAVLGLGYGMSANKFETYCALQGQRITNQFAIDVVNTYRSMYTKIPVLWNTIQSIIHLLTRYDTQLITNYLTIIGNCIYMPSGRFLRYEGVHWDGTMWRLINGKRIYGAQIVENIVQALSRDILCENLLAIHPRYPIVMHTHDELISVVPDDQVNDAITFMTTTMTTPPNWALNLPLNIDISNGKRYGDCK